MSKGITIDAEWGLQYPDFYNEVGELLLTLRARRARDAEFIVDREAPLSTRLGVELEQKYLIEVTGKLAEILARYPDPYRPHAHELPRPTGRDLRLVEKRE